MARSYLFVPGNRPERFEKAHASGADAVILDLEDAVPPAQKNDARAMAAKWLECGQPTLLRTNAASTQWFAEDLRICALPGVAGIVLPKAETVEELAAVRAVMPAEARLLPLIETARGFSNALAPGQSRSVERLIFGPLDFQLDLNIAGDDEELLYFRSHLVLLSRLAGLQPPVDGINANLDDETALRRDTLRARKLGFGGKLLIHPKQIAIVHECFLPSAEEIAWARRVIAAAAAAQGAAVAMEGELVDTPIIAKAEAILNEVEHRHTGSPR
jgi:citrate lyase subunit beta/citryl-CoA lyase